MIFFTIVVAVSLLGAVSWGPAQQFMSQYINVIMHLLLKGDGVVQELQRAFSGIFRGHSTNDLQYSRPTAGQDGRPYIVWNNQLGIILKEQYNIFTLKALSTTIAFLNNICFNSRLNRHLGMKWVFKHQDCLILGLKLNKYG